MVIEALGLLKFHGLPTSRQIGPANLARDLVLFR
jgi:hypothetical protein